LSLNTTDFEKLDAKFVEVNNIVNSYCELYKDEVFEKNGMIIA
jgi:hypothetical protein